MNERLKVKDHTDCTHRVSRSAGDGPIYVAIRRTATEDHYSGSDIEVTATTLAEECYDSMFAGCTKLSAVTCLATNISATLCTEEWLKDAGTAVTGEKTFTTPSSTNWVTNSRSGIPDG